MDIWETGTSAHTLHHDIRYPAKQFIERGSKYITSQPFWLESIYVLIHFPLFLQLMKWSHTFAISSFLVFVFYAILAHYAHPMSHIKTGLFYEEWSIWKIIRRRHAIHHHNQMVNFNLLLPVGDWVFNTLDVNIITPKRVKNKFRKT